MSTATNSNEIISKPKTFYSILLCISEMYIKFGILWKKRWASEIICFSCYRLQKADLFKCPKSPVWECLWTVNMLKVPKYCLNLHGSIFCHIFWSFRKKISSKKSNLVVSKILRLFGNILTADDKYSLSVKASV